MKKTAPKKAAKKGSKKKKKEPRPITVLERMVMQRNNRVLDELASDESPEAAKDSVEVQTKMAEFSKRLDEINEKFSGELTPEQRKEKQLLMHKVTMDSIKEFNRIWNSLSRSRKRKLVPAKNKFSAKVKKRLKQ